jgi:hypothetical protein
MPYQPVVARILPVLTELNPDVLAQADQANLAALDLVVQVLKALALI